jgi:hypothetical protein
VDELGEGVMIALPRPFHEPSLVHGHLARRHDPIDRVYSLWRHEPPNCSRAVVGAVPSIFRAADPVSCHTVAG